MTKSNKVTIELSPWELLCIEEALEKFGKTGAMETKSLFNLRSKIQDA